MSPESLLLNEPPIPHNQKPISDTADSVNDLFKHKEATFPRLNSNNYSTWSKNCKHLLQAIDVWSIVSGEELPPPNPGPAGNLANVQRAYEEKLKDYNKRYHRATNIIYNSISANSRPYIDTTEDPSEMWTILRQPNETHCRSPYRRSLHTPARY